MKQVEGDIWDLHAFGYAIIVPTNIGWRRDGRAIFGRGIAEGCAERFPMTLERWGAICESTRERTTTYYDEEFNLFYFPVKPLNMQEPALSWKQKADYELIKQSLSNLLQLVDRKGIRHVVTPLVGCGNGGLAPKDIKPLLEKNLDDRFTLIRPCFAFSTSKQETSGLSQT